MKTSEWFRTIKDFGNLCAYCQIREYQEKDHFIPRSKGGKDSVTNYLPACIQCNKRKTNLTGTSLIAVFGEDTIERLRIYLEDRFKQSITFPEEPRSSKRTWAGHARGARLNVTIPDVLYNRLKQLRDRMNLSKVCAKELEKEVAMLEGQPNITDPRIAQLLRRLQGTRERWYQRGHEDGMQWAVETANREELQLVATRLGDLDGQQLMEHRRMFHVHTVHGHVHPMPPKPPMPHEAGFSVSMPFPPKFAEMGSEAAWKASLPPKMPGPPPMPEQKMVVGHFGPHMAPAPFPESFHPEERIHSWLQQEHEGAESTGARVEVDEAAYLEGWRDAVRDIWKVISPAL